MVMVRISGSVVVVSGLALMLGLTSFAVNVHFRVYCFIGSLEETEKRHRTTLYHTQKSKTVAIIRCQQWQDNRTTKNYLARTMTRQGSE
jgi:hypothetical protein